MSSVGDLIDLSAAQAVRMVSKRVSPLLAVSIVLPTGLHACNVCICVLSEGRSALDWSSGFKNLARIATERDGLAHLISQLSNSPQPDCPFSAQANFRTLAPSGSHENPRASSLGC